MSKLRNFRRTTVDSDDKKLTELMRNIERGKIQLPDFQRDWTWNDDSIRKLIASILQGFPIGVAMLLKTDTSHQEFKYRPIEGLSEPNIEPTQLILDGQQRLTSIYSSLFGNQPVKTKNSKNKPIQRYYYLDMKKALNGEIDIIDSIIAVNEDKQKIGTGKVVNLDLSRPESEFENHMFPLNIILDSSHTREWIYDYSNYHNRDQESYNLQMEFQHLLTDPTEKYEMTVIELGEDTPREAVCQIFENVNTSGVPLTVFELLTAMYAMDNFNLREDWEIRYEENFNSDILSNVENVDFLIANTLLSSYLNKKTATGKRNDVLNLSLEDYKKNADLLTVGFQEAEKLLQEERIYKSKDLPYRAQLIPLAVICAIYSHKGQLNNRKVRNKIKEWYWNGVFGELYGRSTESRYASDINDMALWLENSEHEPKTIRDAYFTPNRLLELKTRNSSAYKGIMALILKNKARDFKTGREMDLSVFNSEEIDVHHIFPQKYCNDHGLDKNKWNSIVNKTPISKNSNQVISKKSPSKYLEEVIAENVPAEEIPDLLKGHGIDMESFAADDFDSFFIKRASTLLNLIEKAMNKSVQGRESKEVIEAFGGELA